MNAFQPPFYNIREFGAKGDGRAKDTAAVLAVLYRLARGSEVTDPRESLRGQEAESASAAVAPVLRRLVLMVMQEQDGRPPPLDELVKFPDTESRRQ